MKLNVICVCMCMFDGEGGQAIEGERKTTGDFKQVKGKQVVSK